MKWATNRTFSVLQYQDFLKFKETLLLPSQSLCISSYNLGSLSEKKLNCSSLTCAPTTFSLSVMAFFFLFTEHMGNCAK